MKKLLYITTNLQSSGGVSRILSVKLNYLIETYGYTIHVITTNNASDTFFYEFNKKIVFHKINIKNFGIRNILNYKLRLQAIVDNVEADVIVNCDNGLKGSLFPYLIKTSKPLIYERHCSRYISVANLFEKIKLMVSNLFLQIKGNSYNYFIVQNEDEKNAWSIKNIIVIPNPMWISAHNLRNDGNSKIVVAVGRHSYEKRYDKLINIWELLIKQHPDWILKIYGAKNEIHSLEKTILVKKMESNIQFFKPEKDINKIYGEASILISTSSSESFPLTFIEAMAYGLPVIAFYNHGSKSIIVDGENGYLVKENDIHTYLKKLNLLIKNKKIRIEMGKNAKESTKKFDIQVIMKQWHELLKSLK